MWLIILGKYLDNLGERQRRAEVAKSMLAGAEDKLGNGPCGFVIKSWASP